MKKVIKELIESHYSEINNKTEIKIVFEKTLINFIEFHNFQKNGDYDTLFCNIHTNFTDGHNCVACNLNDSNRRIEQFLLGYKLFADTYTTMTNFIILLYLQVECVFEYLSILQLPDSYVQKNFQSFYTVKRWANFLKHPKAFMLVHHPIWDFKKEGNLVNQNTPIIDTNFVKKFYAGESKNKELIKMLSNKEKLIVVFPNPLELITEFCQTQKKFTELISENKLVRDLLDDKATLKDFFESQDEVDN